MIMLDTTHFLSFDPSFLGSPPVVDDMEKAGLKVDHDRLVYHSLKEGGRSVTHADVFDIVQVQIFLSLLSLAQKAASDLHSFRKC